MTETQGRGACVCVCVRLESHGVPGVWCRSSQQQKTSSVSVIVLAGQVQSSVPCLRGEGCVLNYTTVEETCVHNQHALNMEVPEKVKGHRYASHHVYIDKVLKYYYRIFFLMCVYLLLTDCRRHKCPVVTLSSH